MMCCQPSTTWTCLAVVFWNSPWFRSCSPINFSQKIGLFSDSTWLLYTTHTWQTSVVVERQGPSHKLGIHLFAHFNIGRPKTFNVRSRYPTWWSNVLKQSMTFKYNKLKDQVNFLVTNIGFSSSYVSHDFLLEQFSWMLKVSEHSTSRKLSALVHMRLLFETSDIRRVWVVY